MLDYFLILGQVPGTSYRLGFWQIIGLYIVGFLLVVFIKKHRFIRQLVNEAVVFSLVIIFTKSPLFKIGPRFIANPDIR